MGTVARSVLLTKQEEIWYPEGTEKCPQVCGYGEKGRKLAMNLGKKAGTMQALPC